MTSLLEVLTPPPDSRIPGVVIAIVTNNKDPDGLGRVKVKYPWVPAESESDWARVATPMAGGERGMWFLPEVDDEVLVAFMHGCAANPVVVGSLWNGKAKPPEKNDDGKNNFRTIKSRSGHIIRLDDTEGAEKIEILDKAGKNTVVIDSKANTVTVNADKDITIKSASGNISLDAASGKISLSGKTIEIVSSGEAKVEASSTLNLSGSSKAVLKGGTVEIN